MILVEGLLGALSFMTRIPMPRAGSWRPGVAGAAVAFFPAVGILLGTASMGLAWLLLGRLALPPHFIWALVLITLQALLTGAMHLDGLADTADGLGGSMGDRLRALEIMKDPRIGVFGAVTLILFLIAKVAAMDEVLRGPDRLAVLLAYPVAARFGASLLVVFLPPAASTGLAHTFHEESRWPAALAATLVTGGFLFLQGWRTSLPAAWALGAAIVTGLYIASRLRGLTGDGSGAAIEIGELAFLFASALPRIRGGS